MADMQRRMLCFWGPSAREVRLFCRPELQALYERECRAAGEGQELAGELQWEALWEGPAGRLEWVSCGKKEHLTHACRSSAVLTALVEVGADGPTLDAALAQARNDPQGAWSGPRTELRTLVLGGPHAKTAAEKHLRREVQQRLAVGTETGSSCRPQGNNLTLWAVKVHQQLEQQAQQAAAAVEGISSQQEPPRASSAARVLLGVELARGGSAALAGLRRGKGQAGGGPTQMRPELALLTANLAGLPQGALVLDPFCGTGSLLAAAAACGAGFALGSDMEPALGSGEGSSCCGARIRDAVVADASRLQLRPGCLDAILCDLPYGYRASVVVSKEPAGAGPAPLAGSPLALEQAQQGEEQQQPAVQGGSPAWRQLLDSLLQLGGYALAPGGRLVAWLPHSPPASPPLSLAEAAACGAAEGWPAGAQPCSWLQRAGAQQGLQLRHYLPESRQGGFPRAVAVLQQGQRAPLVSAPAGSVRTERGQAQLRSSGHPVAAVPSQGTAEQQGRGQPEDLGNCGGRAGLRRDLRYSQARQAAQGCEIDIWRAAWVGDVASVRSYLEAGGDPDARDSKGQTPLQFAAGYGRAAVVELLLRAGADCGAALDKGRMAPLHRAAARGHSTVAALVLQHGADPCQRSAVGQTPLMYAAQFGHRATLALLLQPRWHAGAAARQLGDGGSAESAAGASSYGQPAVEGVEFGGGGASGTAMAGLRANVAQADNSGLTALHLSGQWGMADVARDLILGPTTGGPQTDAVAAAEEQQLADCSSSAAALAAGAAAPVPPAGPAASLPASALLADLNCRTANEEGLTPAHLAARWGHVGVLRVLCQLGADLQAASLDKGRTPLQEAQEWSRSGCIEFLAALQPT